MWIYKYYSEEKSWKVGYLELDMGETGSYHTFIATEPYKTQEEARKAVNYLNGGNTEVEVSGIIYNHT